MTAMLDQITPHFATGFFAGVIATGLVFTLFWLFTQPKPPQV